MSRHAPSAAAIAFGALVSATFALPSAFAAEPSSTTLPPPAPAAIDFDRDIRPILDNACIRCHGPEKPKSRFRLDDRDAALRGGSYGIQIVPGKSAESRLIAMVAHTDPELEMPPQDKGDPLTPAQVALLRAWIDQGATWGQSSETNRPHLTGSVSPGLQFVTVKGNEHLFREHQWMREGWSGGLSEFSLREPLSKDTTLSVDGRIWANQRDFDFKLSLEKRETGFLRFGADQFSHDSNGVGGVDPLSGLPAPALNQELRLDVGRVWVEAGLTLPDVPRMTLGYEHRYRRGDQAETSWGYFTSDPANDFSGRGILPVARYLNESSHLVKFDIAHEIGGFGLEDSFRGEFFDLKSHRETTGWFAPDSGERHDESASHFNASNAFRLEKPVYDWLLVSGGYLYNSLDGEAGFSQEYFLPSDPTVPAFAGDLSQGIILNRTAHVVNANAQLGPWEGLSFSSGVQGEWSHQEGLGDAATRGGVPTHYSANTRRGGVEERFDLRYTAIPLTVIHAETRFSQDKTDQFERSEMDNGGLPPTDEFSFARDTDTQAQLREFKGGFTFSPWRAVSLQFNAKHQERSTDYDHLTDLDFGAAPGNGYPAFMESRELRMDQFEVKLITRPWRWLRNTIAYQVSSLDYWTATAPISVFDTDPNTGDSILRAVGGGNLLAGNYDARTVSLTEVFTLIPNLYWSVTGSYTDSRLMTESNLGNVVVPHAGSIWSLITSANYTWDAKTSLRASYSFSQADYGQSNQADGLPLGTAYDRHGILTGITRQLRDNVTTTLQYGFFRYHEPTAARLNDYTAHAVFAVLQIALR